MIGHDNGSCAVGNERGGDFVQSMPEHEQRKVAAELPREGDGVE